MTRDEILRGIKNLEPWWHCIDLGHGIKTKTTSLLGEDVEHAKIRWETLKQYVPADLTRRTVLDVGCSSGFFSVEAKRRGADKVLGIDTQRRELLQANFVRKVLGLDIEFQQMSVYELNPASIGRFDITFGFGLLYHCKHLLLAIERLATITKSLLVIDSSVLPDGETRTSSYRFGSLHETIHLMGYVSQAGKARNESVTNWFMPTAGCLQSMLIDAGFDKVDIVLSEGQRAVLVCHKSSEEPDSSFGKWLGAELRLESGPNTCHPGEEMKFVLSVTNIGYATWLPSQGGYQKGSVWMGAHLFSEAGIVAWDFGGVSVDREVGSGETIRMEISLQVPNATGTYYIEFDMVCEQITWFHDAGSKSLIHIVDVS